MIVLNGQAEQRVVSFLAVKKRSQAARIKQLFHHRRMTVFHRPANGRVIGRPVPGSPELFQSPAFQGRIRVRQTIHIHPLIKQFCHQGNITPGRGHMQRILPFFRAIFNRAMHIQAVINQGKCHLTALRFYRNCEWRVDLASIRVANRSVGQLRILLQNLPGRTGIIVQT